MWQYKHRSRLPPRARRPSSSCAPTLDWLGGDVHHIEQPVDPVLEMTAITKAFDGSKVLVADNVTGYPRPPYLLGPLRDA